jgi:hypothetical protein
VYERQTVWSDVELCVPVLTWGFAAGRGSLGPPGTLGPVWDSKSPTEDGRHSRRPGWDSSPVRTTIAVHSFTIAVVPGDTSWPDLRPSATARLIDLGANL